MSPRVTPKEKLDFAFKIAGFEEETVVAEVASFLGNPVVYGAGFTSIVFNCPQPATAYSLDSITTAP